MNANQYKTDFLNYLAKMQWADDYKKVSKAWQYFFKGYSNFLKDIIIYRGPRYPFEGKQLHALLRHKFIVY